MSLVFSGAYGSPEAASTRLRTIESVAPVVMWIDEMEAALSTPKRRPPLSHGVRRLPHWMQEKPPLVFVAATANRIEMLPPRSSARDASTRSFSATCPEGGARGDTLDTPAVPTAPTGRLRHGAPGLSNGSWSGAEIEQAVISARIDAYQADGRWASRTCASSAT